MILRASARRSAGSPPYPGNAINMSLGMPQAPSGSGIIAPEMLDLPELTMSMMPCRSIANVIARRSCSLSNGGLLRFTIRFVLTPVGTSSQIAFGERANTSPMRGIVTSATNVRSNSLAEKARMRVERLPMIRNSISSRYGRPGFQYAGFLVNLIDAFESNVANLNGPVPIGFVRMSFADTWHG